METQTQEGFIKTATPIFVTKTDSTEKKSSTPIGTMFAGTLSCMLMIGNKIRFDELRDGGVSKEITKIENKGNGSFQVTTKTSTYTVQIVTEVDTAFKNRVEKTKQLYRKHTK